MSAKATVAAGLTKSLIVVIGLFFLESFTKLHWVIPVVENSQLLLLGSIEPL